MIDEITINSKGEIIGTRRDIPPPGMFPTAEGLKALHVLICLMICGASIIFWACAAFCWIFGI
jgi:hypothetical protein